MLMIAQSFTNNTLLFWPGVSAVFTGVLVILLPDISSDFHLMMFCMLSILSTGLWNAWLITKRYEKEQNTRAKAGRALIGTQVFLDHPLKKGFGLVTVKGRRWRVFCQNDEEAPIDYGFDVVNCGKDLLIVESRAPTQAGLIAEAMEAETAVAAPAMKTAETPAENPESHGPQSAAA